MKFILKSALAATILAGSTAILCAPASAGGVGVSIGIGVPGVVIGSPYGPDYVAYDDDYYYDPIFIGGSWYHGPYRWRMDHGQRVFFVDGGWRHDEWRGGARPSVIMFRNGGEFRNGRNEGFGDATRINARFRPGNEKMHPDQRDDRKNERRDERHDDNHPGR